MEFDFSSPIWWVIGIIWFFMILGLIDNLVQEYLGKKRRKTLPHYVQRRSMVIYYSNYLLLAIFTGFFMIAWWPAGAMGFLVFALLVHIYFAGIYSRRSAKKYTFLDHLAGYANWQWTISVFNYSPRFVILLLLIWLTLILIPSGYMEYIWGPIAVFFVHLLFMHAGYQTELKKRSRK